jgi:predicted TIM-barrel fold metal-dependent hydrolase
MGTDGFHVIDCHHHSGSLEALGIMNPTGAGSAEEVAAQELQARLDSMDATGVDQAILIPGHGYIRPDGMADTRRVNDHIAAYRDSLPSRFPAAMGVVEPMYGRRGLDEVQRCKDELGLAGISFHTRFQGVATNSPLVITLVNRMVELGLVPYVHAVAEVADEALWKVQEVARAVPDTPIVVLDGFSSFERAEEALRAAELTPNLVFDMSLAHSFGTIEHFVRRHGAARVVFGTDLYSHVRAGKNHILEGLLASALDDDAKRAILAGNISRILGLPTMTGAAHASTKGA